MKTVILIPCYNEAKTIEKVVKDFQKEMPHADIYVYDNNSTDGTDEIAKNAGAIVRYEYKQGKGNVVRAMFRELDADCYIMVDGDDTYPAVHAKELERIILNGEADMAIGDRLSSTYFEENDRPFHNTGNRVVRKFINFFFKSDLNDIIPIEYRDRVDGSESKLHTYRDGYKVIRMIVALVRDKRPLFFFSMLTLILLIIAGIYFFPILFKYFSTGYVVRIPTLIMIATVVIVATIIFFTGVILYVLKKQHRDDLEHHLILLNELKKK